MATELKPVSPIICTINYHSGALDAFVPIGTNKDNVLLHDPWKGPHTIMPLNEFNSKLEGNDKTCMLAFKPGRETPNVNLATAAKMNWFTRNQEKNALRSQGSSPTLEPSDYCGFQSGVLTVSLIK